MLIKVLKTSQLKSIILILAYEGWVRSLNSTFPHILYTFILAFSLPGKVWDVVSKQQVLHSNVTRIKSLYSSAHLMSLQMSAAEH